MKKKPNIIFIITDDQGAWAVESETNHDIKTPNLTRLAAQGTTFDEFYCTSPVCSPARASIVTGKIPSCHGIQDWLKKGNLDAWKYPHMAVMDGFDMEDKAIDYLKGHKTYMEYLAENGYHCALSGKWHMGDNINKKKGFEYYFTVGRGGCHYYDADIFENGVLSISHEYITDTITNHALEYLDKMSGEGAPFYLSVHYTAPHSPWEENEHPKEFRDLYKDCEFKDTPDLPIHPWQANTCPIGDTPEKRREYLTGYYAAISAMDAGVGKIMDWVEDHGLEDDTVIIDNGASSFLTFSSYLLSADVPNLLDSMGHSVFINTIVTGGDTMGDTMHGFGALASQFPTTAKILVWLNPYFGIVGHGNLKFQDSPIYKDNKDKVLALIELPDLARETFGMNLSRMLKERLTFPEAILREDSGYSIMDRQRLRIAQRKIFSVIPPEI